MKIKLTKMQIKKKCMIRCIHTTSAVCFAPNTRLSSMSMDISHNFLDEILTLQNNEDINGLQFCIPHHMMVSTTPRCPLDSIHETTISRRPLLKLLPRTSKKGITPSLPSRPNLFHYYWTSHLTKCGLSST